MHGCRFTGRCRPAPSTAVFRGCVSRLQAPRLRCYEGGSSASIVVATAPIECVQDDLDDLLDVLPVDLRDALASHPQRPELIEIVLDLGRRPEARFQNGQVDILRDREIDAGDLRCAEAMLGEFGGDNRAGIEGTLHRISALRNRKGAVVGLTCRVGRAVSGHVDMVQDLLADNHSLLFLGRPGVGKTTVIREIARVLSDELGKRVVIVDTSNEIGGDGDVPHPAIGMARRMQVPDPARQHDVMIEAVENHMPQVVIVDEIGTELEALACRTIAERGVTLIGTAHGTYLENLIKNPVLSDLVGGVQSVTLGDEEAKNRGTQKSVLERRGPATFPVVVEMRSRSQWVAHQTDRSVDEVLKGKMPAVQVRQRDPVSRQVSIEEVKYDRVEDPAVTAALTSPSSASPDGSYDGDSMSASDAWVMERYQRGGGVDPEVVAHDMAVLRMLGGQSTILGPRQHGFMYLAGSQAAAAGGATASKRAGKRAKAKAARGGK